MTQAPPVPDAWFAQFDGQRLTEKPAVSALLATVDEAGRPHLTFLSAGEVLAARDRVALALWPTSGSSANLRRGSPASLYATADGVVWEVRLRLLKDAPGLERGGLAIFLLSPFDHRRHAAPYASVSQMVSFQLHAPDEALRRWENQIAALRSVVEATAALS